MEPGDQLRPIDVLGTTVMVMAGNLPKMRGLILIEDRKPLLERIVGDGTRISGVMIAASLLALVVVVWLSVLQLSWL